MWRFDSGRAGPVVMVNALTHGNELCGAHALKMLLDSGVRPLNGRLILSFANPEAYAVRCADGPGTGRYLDRDFNRLWSGTMLDGPGSSREELRARELRPFVAEADYLLDIHSMTLPGPPIMLSGAQPRGRALADALGVAGYIVADAGHQAGTRMRDFGAFAAAKSQKTALLIECGQHDDGESIATAKHAAIAFLAQFGVPVDQAEQAAPNTQQDEDRPDRAPFVEVTEAVVAQTSYFTYLGAMQSFDVIKQAGTLIARDGATQIMTPYSDCVALMPGSRVAAGQTAVRLGRFIQ